jgi:hypothetical protein
MGFSAFVDCDLGFALSHGGGYPGYGSRVLLLPEQGVGIFALANRTYAGPSAPVWDTAMALHRAGFLQKRSPPLSADLASAYRSVGAVYAQGDIAAGGDVFAMNFPMDRDAAGWQRDIAALKRKVGECNTTAALGATAALSGDFTWRCEHGRLAGSILLAPTRPPRIQSIKLAVEAP